MHKSAHNDDLRNYGVLKYIIYKPPRLLLESFESGKSEEILPNYLRESTRQSACFVMRSRVNVREQSRITQSFWRDCSP
jgi:hypothetical protein